jgi:glycosyltransferase involved in cell wall biosynthesis
LTQASTSLQHRITQHLQQPQQNMQEVPPHMPSPTSLRIIHVARAPAGGVLRHIIDLATHQTAQGHDVGLICDTTANGSLEEQRISILNDSISLGVTRLDIGRRAGVADLAALHKTRNALKKLHPDIVHGHGAKGGMLARLGATGLKTRPARLYSPHGGSLHFSPQSLEGKVYFTIERALERVTDSLVFVSAFEQAAYHSKIGIPHCHSALIHNGVSEDEFIPVTPSPDATDLLFVGHMRHLKGVDVLLDAIAHLQSQGRRITATLVGAGEDKPAFEAQALQLGINAQVTFLPPLPVREAFARGKVMVIPSRAESLPYIVLETVAAAVPLIASDVGGIPEIMGNGDASLVEAGNPAVLAHAIAGMLDDLDAERQRAALRADSMKAQFSADAMSQSVLDLYRQVALK